MTRRDLSKRKRGLRQRGVTYQSIADEAHVTWQMVWYVLNGRRVSARILAIVDQKLSA